ncbi:MAG: toll/interleukin-1 receptor domain-containing protein [Pseudolabrys sp.]
MSAKAVGVGSPFALRGATAMKEIFLSYSRRDSSTVQALAAALEEKGVSVWIDRSGIEEGDAYDTQIEEAIARTRVVIVVWSQHSVRSHWVRAEAAYALNNHKLMPIAIDNTEPPLQFHHIQTISFDGWDGAGHDEAFTRLLAVLAKRLDRAGTLGEPALGETAIRSKEPVAPPQANAKQNRFVRMFATGLVTAGLRFPEKVIEREFRDYFRDRTYMIAQVAFLLVFITYIIYGVSDLASEAAINSTRFRYMVACPLLLVFYFLSYKEFARRHSQQFIAAFAVTLSICVYISVVLLSIETPFSIANGNGTMNFMLTLGALGAMPLGFVLTVLVGAAISALHALIMMHIPMSTSWLNYLHVSSMWTVAAFVAFWREYQMRRSFAAELS